MLVADEHGVVIAQPVGWDAMAEREAVFEAAEDVRLLYVAATRAKRELVVSRLVYSSKSGPAEDKSAWSPLGGVLDELAEPLVIPDRAPPGPVVSPVTVEAIEQLGRAIVERQRLAAVAGWDHRTVTEEAKRSLEPVEPDQELRRRVGHGREWGRAVHRVLEARGRGRLGASLAAFARAVAAEEQVKDVDRLLALVARLEQAGYWDGDAGTLVEAPIVTFGERDGERVLLEGVIDAARRVDGTWQVVDWKTDLDSGPDDDARREAYRRQVDTYAAMMRGVLGVEAAGRLEPLGNSG
jgi:ATP-dependent helicase/nuclease subunit A